MLHRFLVWELTVLACAGAGGVEPPAVYGVQIPAERRFGRSANWKGVGRLEKKLSLVRP